jgi:hypothetical protein
MRIALEAASILRPIELRGSLCRRYHRGRRQRSRHLGNVGDWLDVVVLVERHLRRPSAQYGTVCRHDLINVDGNRLAWWQTSGAPFPQGHAIHLRARVARHTHFGCTAVTVLIGCRPLDRIPCA